MLSTRSGFPLLVVMIVIMVLFGGVYLVELLL